jgi:hypothetical protein
MKGGMLLVRRINKLSILVCIALLAIVITVMALPSNWFEAAKIDGVVVKTESSTVKAVINMGNLTSATDFSFSGDGNISVAESGGLQIGKFIMGHPEYTPEEGYVYERYLVSRFYRLWLNFTIESTTVNMPIVTDGTFSSYYTWYSEYSENQWRYYRYYYWTPITLPSGNYTTTFKIYGTTTLTTQNLTVAMMFYFALTPP